ncbi:tRNA pseudouridine(38-40) synthase TruA [Buchnera aphidicola]|uniref:tRNA pseudouridine synthase A n=1 Tax=Buchnera aphidicola (Therioaphis trifolii) TaxID=1241884 RepID=A0A4D6YME5_9GAMM|nr:tRNA pseudouridine(38-40) synthase TruA [Buchnera aphidicola]QCI27144.1 tRNA pseudouridine(38-40) synthase TruA [Buchnera aphidicola (Therioaphis trifolii)]
MIKVIKFALGLEYDGSYYHGWQSQKSGFLNVQTEVEKAISIVANHNVSIFCAGRTDSKVHSFGQVIHFETTAIRKNFSWIFGINNYLPKNISVKWIKNVPSIFHARYSAVSRSYRYIIYNSKFRSALFNNRVNYISKKLNIKEMYKASQCIIGEYDFTSFRSNYCQSNSPYRKIININIFKLKKFIFIDIEADSFLQYMVRNIIGCLIDIGKMKKNFKWIIYVLKKKNRSFCSSTANPYGLYLLSIKYPNCFKIPVYNF